MKSLKVAVITYHRAYNYGSALQAYALNCFINQCGIECVTIDYRTEKQDALYTVFEKNSGVMSIARNLQSFWHYRDLCMHKQKFDAFLANEIPMTSECRTCSDLSKLCDQYDFFVCGSDQIWNPDTADFDCAYLLDFISDKEKCIAYAPSVGISYMPDTYRALFSKNLTGFGSLATREESGAEIISELTGRNVQTVLDPVFLLSQEEWRTKAEKANIKGKYILGYYIGDVAGMRPFADRLRKQYGMSVVVIYKNLRDLFYRTIERYDAGPCDFLGLIMDAELIVTNSFHAVAFSIIFEKKFWFFEDIDNPVSAKGRVYNILDLVGIRNRIINTDMMDIDNPDKEIDYNEVRVRLTAEIQKSKQYLLNAFGLEKAK